ncbi:polysaccharide deacetylase family protein [Aquibacillus salsiterrae]|uniref:Polysaccharide deacetylase family protein n=1 Tax=Aquibacillus salsiterrae TaxID=2950439 RepID=A0A9X4AFZ0_9BACI|nr:polysaccharide deacetylase family protein [Aquibacillus salsiterrae]MDC3416528.1 polysaccharide deacetylase family protein [Aquibacillus salsiterrae]
MKSKWHYLLIAILVLLVGCGQSVSKGVEEKGETTSQQLSNDQEQKLENVEKKRDDSADKAEEKEETTVDKNEDEPNEVDEPEEAEIIEPKYQLTDYWSVKPIDDAPEQVVLLTIDDAPDKYALQMATTLKELNAKAIFFVNGHFLNTEEKKEVLKQIYDMGFPIGNHTINHQSLPDLSEQQQREEIVKLNDIVEEVTGERPKFFRAPFGQNTEFSTKLAAEENMLLMNWSFGYDWEKDYQSEEAIADIMINTELLGNGSNLLMHDREWTAKALDKIVKGLRDKGYTMVDPALIKTP